jgi:RNA polymerase sigma factor (sigma-70 family)
MKSQTQATLLERLRDAADPLAWDEFFRRYWRLIFSLARRRGCSEHTAEEVVQDVMLAVFEQRDVFCYDPARGRFHDWLATVVRNLVAGRRRRPAERVRAVGGDASRLEPEAESAAAAADSACEAAFEQALLATLLDVVRREVTPETFQAFELLALDDLPGAQVATLTGLSRNAVYLARRRMLARLKELGASYADDGQLSAQVGQALCNMPAAAVERSVTSHVAKSMCSRVEKEAAHSALEGPRP